MPKDNFASITPSLSSVASKHYSITPDDNMDVDPVPRALFCVTEGNIAVLDKDGVEVVYPVMAGQILPFRATRVKATGTTASVIGWE